MALADIEEARNISVDTLESCGVRWVDNDDYAVRFEYRNYTGSWYDRKGLKPGASADGRGKILSPPNSEPHMYNPLRIGPNAGLLFLCEGEYDTLSVIDAGFDAVGSQGTGTFKAVWARLFTGATTVIAFDGDASGRQASVKLRKLMKGQGAEVYILDMPDGMDLNDLHQEGKLQDYLTNWLDENEVEYE